MFFFFLQNYIRCGDVRIVVFENSMLRFVAVFVKGKIVRCCAIRLKKNIKKPHRTVTKCTPVFKNRTVRCDADSSLEHPAVRFGAILLKAKPHRTGTAAEEKPHREKP